MNNYTIVGIHFNGLGWVVHCTADTAEEALSNFDSWEKGMAIAVFGGHLINRVRRRLVPGSPTKLESE